MDLRIDLGAGRSGLVMDLVLWGVPRFCSLVWSTFPQVRGGNSWGDKV